MSLTLVILAAGMGSRYWWLKQLDSFGQGGHTLMEYSIYDAKKAGFDKVVFVIRKDFEAAFKEQIGAKVEKVLPVTYAFQDMQDLPEPFVCPATREKPWGTWHAVLCALPYVDWSFAVINADDFYGRESYQVLADFLKDDNNSGKNTIVGYVLSEVLSDYGTVSRGICELDILGNLKAIHETKNIKKEGESAIAQRADGTSYPLELDVLCSMNMMGFSYEVVPFYQRYFVDFLKKNINEAKEEFYMPEVISRLINEEGQDVPVLPTRARWFWVTYQEDKEDTSKNINALIQSGVYPEHLWD